MGGDEPDPDPASTDSAYRPRSDVETALAKMTYEPGTSIVSSIRALTPPAPSSSVATWTTPSPSSRPSARNASNDCYASPA